MVEDLVYLLDEQLHAYQTDTLKIPDSNSNVVLFVSIPKVQHASEKLHQLNGKLKYLANTNYDIYILHETDILAIHQVLTAF